MEENLQIFNKSVAQGPTYVCTCCQQLWFNYSVSNVGNMVLNKPDVISLFEKCRTHYISVNYIEWICNTCRQSIHAGKIPKLSIPNGMGFPEKTTSTRLVSPRGASCFTKNTIHANSKSTLWLTKISTW